MKDVVASLESWLVGPDGDAAIAIVSRRREFRLEQFETNTSLGSARDARIGEVLQKSGYGTGLTQALVDGVGRYSLTLSSSGPIQMEGFRLVPSEDWPTDRHISDSGDSGAIWYCKKKAGSADGVGLHVAGERSNREQESAIACHLPKVLSHLRVSIAPP